MDLHLHSDQARPHVKPNLARQFLQARDIKPHTEPLGEPTRRRFCVNLEMLDFLSSGFRLKSPEGLTVGIEACRIQDSRDKHLGDFEDTV